MKNISTHIKDLREIIHMLELRLKTAQPESRKVYQKVIHDIEESIKLLEEEVSSGREANESFWAQHQEKIDRAWHDVIVHTLNEIGEANIDTTRERPE